MMDINKLQRGSIATAAISHPVANSGDRTAAKLRFISNFGVFTSIRKQPGRFQPGTDFNDFFFCHDITQKILHYLHISNFSQNRCELLRLLLLPDCYVLLNRDVTLPK